MKLSSNNTANLVKFFLNVEYMPLEHAAGPRFLRLGPKIECILTKNPVFDHVFLSKDLLGPLA